MNLASEINKLKKVKKVPERTAIIRGIHGVGLSRAFMSILKYAFDPMIKFNLKQIPKDINVGSQELKDVDLPPLFDMIINESSTTSKKDLCKRILEPFKKEDQEILREVISQKLKIGMQAKGINKFYPGLISEFGVMLAKPFKDFTKLYNSSWYTSIKYDGVRAVLKDGKFYTRQGHVLPGLEKLLTKYRGCEHTLDGELIMPGKTFQEASGLIRSGHGNPVYKIFDIIDLSLPFHERLKILMSYDGAIKQVPGKTLKELWRTFNNVTAAGYEGLMVKDPTHKYVFTRSNLWLKLKSYNSVDLEIVSVEEGQGKYAGSLGSLVCQFNNKLVKVGSGFTDELRKEIWSGVNTYLGQVVEVEYMEETDEGSLRFPIFKAFRFDKEI